MHIEGIPQEITDRITRKGECWVLRGVHEDGYSRMTNASGERKYVHVAIWEAVTGERKRIGVHLWRRCGTPGCVNPDHMTLGEKGQQDYCKRGHELTEENTYFNQSRGGRVCRKCHLTRQKKYREAKRLSSTKGGM